MNPWQGKVASDMLIRSAEKWPDRPAIIDGPVVVNYRELLDRTRALAGAFLDLGMGEGTHVGTYLAESWEHVIAHYACLYLGAMLVPLNLAWEAREIAFALNKADVEFLLAGETFRDRSLIEKMAEVGLAPFRGVEGTSKVKHVIMLGAAESPDTGLPTLRALLDRGSRAPEASKQPIGYIMFTSGSTAFPKGAMIRQDAALGTGHYVGERLGIIQEDQFLNTLPLYHCGGLVEGLLTYHSRGAALHIFEGFQQEAMLEAMRKHRCNVTGGFDIITMRLVNAYLAEYDDLPLTKIFMNGHAYYDVVTELGIRAVNTYAMTEASNIIALNSVEADYHHRKHSNGRPLPGVDVRIVDFETGESVATGEPGELCFRGWNTMAGYYKEEELKRQVFDEDGYLHTGDYGSMDDEGYVYFRGRYAMMVKTGGENVSEIEVENFLMCECDGVKQAAVVGVPDEKWGEMVVAFVEFTPGVANDIEKLREDCRGRLARFKVPKAFFAIAANEWPLTPTGKLKKADLRERAKVSLGVGR